MSLEHREVSQLVGVARAYLALVDATTIALNDGGPTGYATAAALRTDINRYYAENSMRKDLPPHMLPATV